LTPRNFGLCLAQIKTPRFARRNVITSRKGVAISSIIMRLLRGVYPEQYVEILPLPLHFIQGQGQNDRGRRVRNDNPCQIASVASLPRNDADLKERAQ